VDLWRGERDAHGRAECTLTTSSSSGGAGAHWTAQRISKNLHKVVTSRIPQWFDEFENEPKSTTTNAAAAMIAEKRTGQDHSIGCVGGMRGMVTEGEALPDGACTGASGAVLLGLLHQELVDARQIGQDLEAGQHHLVRPAREACNLRKGHNKLLFMKKVSNLCKVTVPTVTIFWRMERMRPSQKVVLYSMLALA